MANAIAPAITILWLSLLQLHQRLCQCVSDLRTFWIFPFLPVSIHILSNSTSTLTLSNSLIACHPNVIFFSFLNIVASCKQDTSGTKPKWRRKISNNGSHKNKKKSRMKIFVCLIKIPCKFVYGDYGGQGPWQDVCVCVCECFAATIVSTAGQRMEENKWKPNEKLFHMRQTKQSSNNPTKKWKGQTNGSF